MLGLPEGSSKKGFPRRAPQGGPKAPKASPASRKGPPRRPQGLPRRPQGLPRRPQGPPPTSPMPPEAFPSGKPLFRRGSCRRATYGVPNAAEGPPTASPTPLKACQGVHEGSASKAWVFRDVHEGSASDVPTFDCSFGLFHPLAFGLEGCSLLVLLSTWPVMVSLSKRFIQTFLSSGSCRWLLLEVSSFFVHCTKAL